MTTPQSELPGAILAEARGWAIRLRLGGEAARAEFEAWCRADLRHLRAYREVAATIDLAQAAHASGLLRTPHAPPRRLPAYAAIAASMLLTLGVALFAWQQNEGSYGTPSGEMRTLTLEDGSVVYMNGATRLRVAYSEHERAIRLDEGEALFEVAKNPARPFRVQAGSHVIEAVGTAFDVTAERGRVDVAVREGVVKVIKTDAPAEPQVAVLRRGEAMRVALDAPLVTHAVVPEQIGNWRQNELIFQSVAFGQVAEAMSRRYGVRFVVDDPELARTPVSIVLNMRTRDSAIELIERAMEVRAVAKGRGTIVFAPRH